METSPPAVFKPTFWSKQQVQFWSGARLRIQVMCSDLVALCDAVRVVREERQTRSLTEGAM
jgi:hypothetical protein